MAGKRYRLPGTGNKITTTYSTYVSVWKTWVDKLERRLSCKVTEIDPGFFIEVEGEEGREGKLLPEWLVERIIMPKKRSKAPKTKSKKR